MASISSNLFLLLPFLICPSAIAFDITKILDQFPDFSTFNNLLTQTQLAGEINSQPAITVLAVANGALSSVSGQPDSVLKQVLALHVVFDYFDGDKLRWLSAHTAILTTLFQASGRAAGLGGFLNVTDMNNGEVAIGSAVPGSPSSAYFVRVLATYPYDISVLQISGVVVPPGVGAAPALTPTASPMTTPAPAQPTWTRKVLPPAAAPSSMSPGRSLMPSETAPAPWNGASDGALPSGAPALSPPAAVDGGASPAGAPSHKGGAPGPVAAMSDGVAFVPGFAAAVGAAFVLGCSLEF